MASVVGLRRGAARSTQRLTPGGSIIMLRPHDERKRERRARSSSACAKRRATSQGISLYLQAAQDLQIDSRVSRTQYQYTLQDADVRELAEWAPKLVETTADSSRSSRDVASDQQVDGLRLNVDDRSREGVALRRHRRRRSMTRSTTRSASARSRSFSHSSISTASILEVEPNFRSSPSVLDKIYVRSRAPVSRCR